MCVEDRLACPRSVAHVGAMHAAYATGCVEKVVVSARKEYTTATCLANFPTSAISSLSSCLTVCGGDLNYDGVSVVHCAMAVILQV